MNRDQKKTLERAYRKFGKSKSEAKKLSQQMYDIDKIRLEGTGDRTPPQKFQEDDKFMLDVKLIKSRKNYDRMNDAYKQFVADNEGKILTVHVERGNLISAKEEPKWLFWSGDLIKPKEESEEPTADEVE
jgi:hypothetical protein